MSGTVTAEAPVTVTEEEVRDCIASFVGEQQQVPPMYSALKVNGKKLYELAREGIEIERKARTVHFYEISILEMKLPLVRMEVTCSKGTYIRTLCHDIGEKLGCHGCMEQLIRTRVGQFDRNGAHTLDEIAAIVGEGRLSEILVPVDEMFAALRSFATADDHAAKPVKKDYILFFKMGYSKTAEPALEFAKKLSEETGYELLMLWDQETWFKYRDVKHIGADNCFAGYDAIITGYLCTLNH